MINKQTVLQVLEERKTRLANNLIGDALEVELDVLINKISNMPEEDEWIPADEPPETDDYILLSFENFTSLLIGRYESREDGSGNYYIGDCDEEDMCLANNLFVNARQPLPEPYKQKSERETPNWKAAMIRTFLGRPET